MSLPAFDLQGQGADAVLLLHGIGGGRSVWGDAGSRSLQAIAALGCRAVALDLPGYGDSAAIAPVGIATMAGAVADVIAHLAPRRAALVGHSMGGMVALELLATQPRLVQAVVLACTTSAFGQPEGDWQARFVAERLAPLDAGLGMAGMADRLVPGMVSPRTGAAACRGAIDVMSRVPESTYRAALRSVAAFDRRAALPSIDVPALCLAGADDRTAPPATMQRLAAKLPRGEFVCLPQAGHIANVEQPEAFNAALAEFLRSNGFGS